MRVHLLSSKLITFTPETDDEAAMVEQLVKWKHVEITGSGSFQAFNVAALLGYAVLSNAANIMVQP